LADLERDEAASGHACPEIWWFTDNPRLTATARSAIADLDNAVFASTVSGYEIANKQRLGKLPGKLAEILPKALRQARLPAHGPTLDQMIAAGLLPGPHRDPWDRLFIARAMGDGFTVVSLDPVFRDDGVPVCWS
jgi:PIN domain nuclease of toxin-antitoxin system